MPKPYSQDLRDRVIDAVERGEMSHRAAARRYETSECVAIKWLERVERMARESLSGTAATGRRS
jgi:transposase